MRKLYEVWGTSALVDRSGNISVADIDGDALVVMTRDEFREFCERGIAALDEEECPVINEQIMKGYSLQHEDYAFPDPDDYWTDRAWGLT